MDDDQGCIDPRLLQINSPANVSFDEIPFSDAGISELSDTHPLASPIDLDVDPSCWNNPIPESSTFGTHQIDHGEWPDRILAGPIFSSSDANSAFGQGQAPVSYAQRVVPLESNISESITREPRAKARSSPSETVSDETWQSLKNIVRSKYQSRNEPLKTLMNLLENRYEFHATKSMYQDQFEKWEMKKNNQGQSDDDDERFARRRGPSKGSGPYRPVCFDIPLRLAPSSKTWDDMVNLMREFLPKYPHDAFRPPSEAKDAERPWEMLYFQCSGVCALARAGLQARLVPAMQELFQKCRDACDSPDLGFLIYFWKICLALRDMRLRGAPRVFHRGRQGVVQSRSQRAAKAEFPVLRAFLRFLRDALKGFLSHPLLSLVVWLQDSYEASPRFSKETLRCAFSKSINCVEAWLGDNHPLVLSMKSHFAGCWQSEEFATSSNRERYDKLVVHTQREFGETSMEAIALLHEYTFAMSICGSQKGFQKATELALILRDSTLAHVQDPCEALKSNAFTRAYIFSIELLSSGVEGKRGYDLTSIYAAYLKEAVDVLVDGNVECQIWAAHFSKRLCTWYKDFKGKTTFRCKTELEELAAQAENAHLVEMTREALNTENARLLGMRRSIFGPKIQIRILEDSSQSVEPGNPDNQCGISGHATTCQYGTRKCRRKQRLKNLRLRRKQEEGALVSFLVDVTNG